MARRSHRKPLHRQFLTAQVVGSERISPSFLRVTIGGESLREFTPLGFDQWFRLFLPNGDGLRLPTTTGRLWFAEYMLMSAGTRPIGRNYTVRHYRPDGRCGGPEIDVDFALHADADGNLGTASAWATSATRGAELAIFDEGCTYQPPDGTTWQLLVGDETALPAIVGILGSAPRDLRAEVYVEIPLADDIQSVDAPVGVNVNWLVRAGGAASGETALAAVRAATLPEGPAYAFAAGGQKLATGVRRHLVNELGMSKDAVTFTGYWR